MLLLACTVGALWPCAAMAKDCVPNDITLGSQAAVDAFQSNHGPGCDRVVGTLTISGPDIADLDGLAGLTAVWWLSILGNPLLSDIDGLASLTTTTGPLEIGGNSLLANLDGLSGVTNLSGGALLLRSNPSLSDLSGLSGLTSIAGSLVVDDNDALVSLDHLASLTNVVSSINIGYNAVLQSISGLAGLTGFSGHLDLRFNPQLASLDGIAGLTSLNGLILHYNDSLANIDELAGVTTIGNAYAEVWIGNNASLTNLDGLADLVSVNAGFEISDNPSLDQCSALSILMDQVDDALPGPGPGVAGIPDINGDVVLVNNLPGCNAVPEITGEMPAPPFELIPQFGGLGTDIGIRSIALPDASCDWNPGETVVVAWDDPAVELGQFMVDERGCFAGLFLLEDSEQLAGSLPGDHAVWATGSVSGTGKQFFTQVEPQLQLDPAVGPPGLELRVAGCNWGSGVQVAVASQQDATVLGMLTADGAGCLDGSLKAPREKDGLYGLQAAVGGVPVSAAAYLVRGATVFLTPPEGPADTAVPLAGCGWFPEEAIDFAFADNNVVFDTAGTGIGGCITTNGPTDPTLHIPAGASLGARHIRATGKTSKQRVYSPFNVVERNLLFDPPNGIPGDPVSLSGCGWVGNATVEIEWGYPDPNSLPIKWQANVDPSTGCFGQSPPFAISVPANSITGPLEQTATGNEVGTTTAEFMVNHGGTIEFPDNQGAVGQSMTVNIHDAIVGEAISFYFGLASNTFLGSAGAAVSDFSFDFTVPAYSSVGTQWVRARGTKGFQDAQLVTVVDDSSIEVTTPGNLLTGTVVQVEGRGWSATEGITFRLVQGEQALNVDSYRLPAGTTSFSTGVALPGDVPPGAYTLQADGDLGRLAETPITLEQGPTPAFALPAAYADPPPQLDGRLDVGEWDYGQKFDFAQGFITARSDDSRLYVLLNLLGDTGHDPPGDDGFWLSFDIWSDQVIDNGWDLNFRLDASGDLILEEYTGPNSFAPRNSVYLRSAYGAGFGCFAADGSAAFNTNGPVPVFTCNAHRVFEIGIDLNSIDAEPGDLVRLGVRTHSQTPSFTADHPAGFHSDFAELGAVRLAPSALDANPPSGALTGIGANGFGIEVTQATQDVDNSLRLVAGKDTVARVYPQVASEALLRTFLFGRRNGVDLPGSPLVSMATVPPIIDRGLLANTANVLLPKIWTAEGVTELTAIVEDVQGLSAEIFVESFVFYDRRTPTYWVIPINSGSTANPVVPDAASIGAQESHLETVFPLPRVAWVRRGWEDIGPNAPSGADDPDLPLVNKLLNEFRADLLIAHSTALQETGQEPFTFPDQIYGFTNDGGGLSNRIVNGGDAYVSSGNFGTSGVLTMAHEVNHNIDRTSPGTWGRHTTDEDDDADNPEWGCHAEGGNADWPGDTDEIGEVGFDTRRPWKASGAADLTVIPGNFPDYMSYCRSQAEDNAVDGQLPFKWTSGYRWAKQFIQFAAPGPLALSAAMASQPEPVYYVSGELHLAGTGKLDPIRILPGTPTDPIEPGDYVLEIQDAGGFVLLAVPFVASFEPVEEEAAVDTVYFHYRLPVQPNGAKVVLKHLGDILDIIEASSNPPTVEVTAPVAGESWDGVGDIEWLADDPDGDDLSFSIFYSPDSGERWFPVARGLAGSGYQVNTWRLPGGDGGRIRLIATDGFHTVTADSEGAFTVPDPAPAAVIESPSDGQTFLPSEWIDLRGRASLPDGADDDLTLVWFLDGEIVETGPENQIILEEGGYALTLVAFDSEGNFGDAAVGITVRQNDPPDAPSQPSPANGAHDVPTDSVLDWTGGDPDGDPVRFDVYLAAGNPAPTTQVCDDAVASQCSPPVVLLPATSYFWQVIASDDQGAMTASEVWEFMTGTQEPADIIFLDGFE